MVNYQIEGYTLFISRVIKKLEKEVWLFKKNLEDQVCLGL